MSNKRSRIIDPEEAVSYRTPLAVTEYIILGRDGAYPVCPRCDVSLEREYVNYCDRCGQRLSWKGYSKAKERKREQNCLTHIK